MALTPSTKIENSKGVSERRYTLYYTHQNKMQMKERRGRVSGQRRSGELCGGEGEGEGE